MAIRAWPAGSQKKRGAGQDIEPTSPCGPGPHRVSPRPVRAGPQTRIKLKKKLALVYINYFFYGLLH